MAKNYFDLLQDKVNHYRRKYPNNPHKANGRMLIWCLGKYFKKLSCAKSPQIKNYTKSILFNLHGGIGDIILDLNFLIQLHEKFAPDFDFYLSIQKTLQKELQILTKNYKFLKLCARDYNTDSFLAELELRRIPKINTIDFDTLKKESDTLYEWMKQVYSFGKQYPEYPNTDITTCCDFLCTTHTQLSGRNRLQMPDINGLVSIDSVYEIPVSSESETLSKFELRANKYITLQCGIGISNMNTSTREWPIEKYNELIKLIKEFDKNIILVQIGNDKDPKMNCDIDLRGKTSFNEFLAILKNAKLHIGGESGCIHMRHFMGARPSAVLFGPTPMKFYAYPENINISSGICDGCEWVHNQWREFCIKTNSCIPACMQTINSETVFEKIKTKII